MSATYSIGTLAGLTGLSPHTIRAWERRYGALSPTRGDTNRRVYTDSDVLRLQLLRDSIQEGHSIGHVANLTNSELRQLASTSKSVETLVAYSSPSIETTFRELVEAVSRLDPESLDRILTRANAELGILELLHRLVIPLLQTIGQRWAEGSLGISQEHLASTTIRAFLQRVRYSMPTVPGAPRILVATPKEQHHELGALMASIVATIENWNVTYLGSNLPANDIVSAAKMSGARAIGLSLTFPLDEVTIASELLCLRDGIGPRLPILIGGNAVRRLEPEMTGLAIHVCDDLNSFRTALSAMR